MQTVKFYRDHLITPRSLVVFFDSGLPVTIVNQNSRYEEIKGMLQAGDFELIPEAVNLALTIEVKTKGKFKVVNGTIEIDGELLPKSLSDKLIEFVENSLPTEPLEAFWDNLKLNPTESAREDLFSYLEANQVPLTADGCFIAYKGVKDDYYDSYTGGTYLNTPGSVIKMPRDEVDGDRRNTCSAGLHVAAWEYADGFSSRTMVIKINPQNVVAVPPDYNQQKMRVCEYTVVGETLREYKKSIYELAEDNTQPMNRYPSS
jgi:hypothetical protein